MDPDVFRFGMAAFVTLLVVVDPPGVVPIFVALTKDETNARRHAILVRAVLIAFGVAIFFLIAGRAVLSYLGVSVHAFAISGGILLFATALPMLFGQRGGLQAPEEKERGVVGQDISVFPRHPDALRTRGDCNYIAPDLASCGQLASAGGDSGSARSCILCCFCFALPWCAIDRAGRRRRRAYRNACYGNRTGCTCRAIRT